MSDSFLSVSDAAQRLGINERRAYRLAGRLPDADKELRTEGGRPRTFVKLEALRTLLDAAPKDGKPGARVASDSDGAMTDTAALIAQLQTENARLWEALSREQSISMSLATDAQELRRKLLALQGTGNTPVAPQEGESEAIDTTAGKGATRKWWEVWK